MKIHVNWKKTLLIVTDIAIATYLCFAITSWNKPSEEPRVCTKVEINIEDENENGFLKTAEVKALLEKKRLYPLSKRVNEINIRDIEDELCRTAFVKTAQCYIDENAHTCITITQRTPIIRVKNEKGDDFYIDDNGGVMPNSQYTSDMIIATGNISKQYACRYLSIVAEYIMSNDLWRNQIEQINVLPDLTLEIIPRVGDHIVNLGMLPTSNDTGERKEKVTEFIKHQLERLELFYKYGLSEAGWNKYSYISLEFSNQVICTRPEKYAKPEIKPTPKQEETQASPETEQQNQAQKATSEQAKKTDGAKKEVSKKPEEIKKEPAKKVEEKKKEQVTKKDTPTKKPEKTAATQKKEVKPSPAPKKNEKKKN